MIMSQVFKFIDSKSTHKNLYILRKNLFFNLKNKLRSQAYNVLINQLSADLVVCKMLCLCKLHAKNLYSQYGVLSHAIEGLDM